MLIPAGIDLGSRNARLAIVSEAQSTPVIVPNPLGQRYTLALSIEEPKAEADPLNDQYWDKPKKANAKEESIPDPVHYLYGEAARRTLYRLKKSLQPHFVMNLVKDAANHKAEGGPILNDEETKNNTEESSLNAIEAFFCHLTTQAIHASGASAHPSSLRFVVSVPPNQIEGDTDLLIRCVENGTLKCIQEVGFDSCPDMLNSSNLNKRDKKQLMKEINDTNRVLAVITNPVAIAHAHGLFEIESDMSQQWKNILVVDWGASTLTLTCLQNLGSSGMTSIRETKSQSKSCGLNILDILVSHAAELFERSTRGAIPRGETLQNKKAKAKLQVACEDALKSLAYSTKVQVTIDGLLDGIDCQVEIMLARFEMLLMSILRTAEKMINEFVTSCDVEFDGVLSAGGVIRMKCVESMLSRTFKGMWRGKSVGDVAPEEAIALGCASFANCLLTTMETDSTVDDVAMTKTEQNVLLSPVRIALSFKEGDGSSLTMIEKMTPLPALVTKTIAFTEKSLAFDIMQLSKDDDEKLIGKIESSNTSESSLEVTIELSTKGQLIVLINGENASIL